MKERLNKHVIRRGKIQISYIQSLNEVELNIYRFDKNIKTAKMFIFYEVKASANVWDRSAPESISITQTYFYATC